MTSGLAWLNELMVWLGKWFPRLVLVKATHQGVRFGRGGVVKAMAPGLYCYWPITTEVVIVSTTKRTMEIACQLMGQEVVSLAIAFVIADPVVTLVQTHDVFSYLDDRIQGYLGAAYGADKASDQIAAEVLGAARIEFAPYGVTVESVNVLQRGWAFPLKYLNDWAQHGKAELA